MPVRALDIIESAKEFLKRTIFPGATDVADIASRRRFNVSQHASTHHRVWTRQDEPRPGRYWRYTIMLTPNGRVTLSAGVSSIPGSNQRRSVGKPVAIADLENELIKMINLTRQDDPIPDLTKAGFVPEL